MPAPKDPERYEEWKRKLSESVKAYTPPKGNWTQEEIDILNQSYFTHTLQDLTEILPGRTIFAIKGKMKSLGLSKSDIPKPTYAEKEITALEKRCTGCGAIKPISEFNYEIHHKKTRSLSSQCKECKNAKTRAWKERRKLAEALIATEEKACHLCGEVKPINQFSKSSVRADKRDFWCKECRRNYYRDPKTAMATKRYKPLVHEPVDPMVKKIRRLKSQYGITAAQYLEMLEAQNGVCASCGNPETAIDPRTKQVREFLVVDHDHETGKVRALLCNNCNVALGYLQDDPARIEALLSYAKRIREGTLL